MDRPEPSAKTKRLFDDIGEELVGRGVTVGAMFGMPTYKVGSKAIGGLYGDAMVFKLPTDARDDALRLNGAAPFDPMGGRPMKEWVVVPATHARRWRALTEAALAYVSGG